MQGFLSVSPFSVLTNRYVSPLCKRHHGSRSASSCVPFSIAFVALSLLFGHQFFSVRGSTNAAAPSLLSECEARAMPLRRESRNPRVSRIREAACLHLHALIRKAQFMLCAQNVHTTAATKAGPRASPSSARSTTPRPSATCSASPLAPSSPFCSLRGCSSTLEVCISLVLCLAACDTVTSGTRHWRARLRTV